MRPPIDSARCVKTVYIGPWGRSSQCQRKRTVGEYCKQHSPDAVAAKQKAAAEKHRADMAKTQQHWEHAKVGARLFETNMSLYKKLLDS